MPNFMGFGPFTQNGIAGALGLLGGPFTGPHVVIAGSDAPDWIKVTAFRECEGHDDQDTIRSAIYELAELYLGGPTAPLPPVVLYGSFSFSAPLSVDLPGVTLRGTGKSTRINYNGTNPVITLAAAGVTVEYLETDAGGIAALLAGENVLRYWKDGEWTEEIGFPTGEQVMYAWLTHATAHAIVIGDAITPPSSSSYYAAVTAVEVWVKEAFNGGSGNTMTVGAEDVAPDEDAFALAIDVSTTGVKTILAGEFLGVRYTDHCRLAAYYTHGGAEPTTGEALITVHYVAMRSVGVA